MRRAIAVLAGLLLAGCAPPTTAPSNLNISNINTNNNGTTTGGQQDTCKTADTVSINIPTVITHGVPTPVSLIPTLGGQVLSNACGPVNWISQAPCSVGNPGELSTFLSADVAGSCVVQGCTGDICSPEITVTVK